MKAKENQNSTNLLLWIPVVAIVMRLASPITADLSYLVLAIYALFGRVQVIQAFFLSWLFTMLSDGIAPVAALTTVGRYIVIFAATISIFLRSRLFKDRIKINKLLLLTFFLGIFLITHSLVISPFIDVSLLKAISWILVMSTSLLAWETLDRGSREKLEKQLFGGLIAITLISLPLLATGEGYLRNNTGFQGIINHPQAFGPTIALLGAWLAGRFFSEYQAPKWQMGMLGMCFILVVMSEARTAGLALIISVTLSLLVFTMLRGNVRSKLPGLTKIRMVVVAIVVGFTVLFAGSFFSKTIGEYLSKRGEASSILEVAELSRGALVYEMIDNIKQNPLSGIGFGIASNPNSMIIEHDSILGLPLSAAIEKGVLPIAILEELGILGFLVIIAWLWTTTRVAIKGGFTEFSVLTTALLTNFGESMFFSPGGMGLLLIILVAWAVTAPQSNHQTFKTR
jgi:hypothetical protein